MIAHIPALIALLLAPTTVPDMTEDPHALTLEVREQGGRIEVQLIGLSQRAQQVSYLLEVSGQSTSRHRGKTTLTPGATAILSTISATSGADWCVRLVAEEEGRSPYEIREGNCAAEAG